MAEQQRRQSGRAPQRRDDAPADQYGLGLNMSLLDWNQLEPLGEAEAMAAADQDLDFLPDLANELLDEGTDDEAISAQSSESDAERMQLRGGRKDTQGKGGTPVVTTGGNAESSPTAQGPSAVTTGQVPAGRTRPSGRASARRGRRTIGLSASASSGSGTPIPGMSADPSAEPSGSGESGKVKRKKPTPNLDDIDDPAERRKQRRLAKNRATAAVSRERKRVQMIQLAARTRALEQENANLQFMLGLRDQEIGKLRSNLASLPRGAREGEPRTNAAAASPSEPAVLTGVALPLAVTLQQLCLHAPRRSRAALSVLACIMFFLALICLGNPPSQPHPFWAPLEPTRSWDSSGDCNLDWGAPMAWGWPFLLRLAGAHRRRPRRPQPPVRSLLPAPSPPASLPVTGLAPGALSIVGRPGSSQGDLAALWGPRQELAMQGSWENLATLLGNPLPLPLEPLPSAGELEGGPPPQTSSSSSMDRHLEDQMESSSPCSGFLTPSGKSSMEAAPRQTLPIQPHRINKVMTVDIQTGDRQVQERDTSGDIAPPTPPRSQSTLPLRRSLQKKLAARAAASVIAEGAALGTPEGSERPYFKVALGLPLLPKVPITKAEAKRRASVKLLPLGMALLAAESFVQERLHSADICMNVLGS